MIQLLLVCWKPIRFTKNYNFHTAKSSPFSAANLLARGLANTLSPPDHAGWVERVEVVTAGVTAGGGGVGGADTGAVGTAGATGAGAAAESSLKSLNAPTSD
jgi:hypothetical protein